MSRARSALRATVLAAAMLVAAAALPAQQARVVDPGMTKAQVVERLGRPKGERTAGAYTYLFYANDCLKRCGIDDVVTLENDAVVDAIFRSADRRYTGNSSSPEALSSDAAHERRRSAAGAGPRVREPVVGAITTRDSAAVPAGTHGGLVVAGNAPDSASPPPARRGRRRATNAPNTRRSRPTARPVVPLPRLSGTDSAEAPGGAGPAAAADAAGIDSTRTGRRTTTGPVDAGAAVKNAGGRLFPTATPVRPSSGPGADSAAGSSAGRVPFQGSKLAPADSAAAVNRRPRPATPPKSDSTRPSTPPALR